MERNSNERRFIGIDTQDYASCDAAKAEIASFFETAGSEAIAVSFVYLPDAIFGSQRIRHWRAVFGQDEDFRFWGESYTQLDRLIPTLPKQISEIVTTYYHECAQD